VARRREYRWIQAKTATIAAVGAALLVLAGLAAHGRNAIVDRTGFVDRAEAVLARPDVREELALRLRASVLGEHPELAPAAGPIAAAIGDVMRRPAFAEAFRAGAARLHDDLFERTDRAVVLVLPGAMAMIRAAAPALADRLPETADPPLLRLGGGGALERGLRSSAPVAGGLAAWWPALLALGLLLLALAAVRAPRGAALACAAAGALAAVATIAAERVLLSTFTSRHGDAVVDAIWDSYLADVRTGGLLAAAAGLALAAAATVVVARRR
jgi:hypothetical protein